MSNSINAFFLFFYWFSFILQYNKLRGCQVPSWIYCIFEGNGKDICKDDGTGSSSIHRGVIDDAIQGMGRYHSHNGKSFDI